MVRTSCALLTAIWLSGVCSAGDGKSTEVVLDGLKSKTPAGWVSQKPESKLRLHQFQVAKDVELAIFHFPGGGSLDENTKRWKAAFIPPKDKSIDDVTKIDTFKVGKVDVTTVDIEGTFLYRPPGDFKAKPKELPGYRRINVYFASDNGPYFITMTGPAKAVAEHKKAFDGWLKAFK